MKTVEVDFRLRMTMRRIAGGIPRKSDDLADDQIAFRMIGIIPAGFDNSLIEKDLVAPELRHYFIRSDNNGTKIFFVTRGQFN